MLPWFLFGLTPRDRSGPQLRVFNQWFQDVVLVASSTHDFPIDSEHALILTGWSVDMTTSTAGTTAVSASMRVIAQPGGQATCNITTTIFDQALAGVLRDGGDFKQMFVLCPPGSIVRSIAQWNQAGTNTVQHSITGVLIPKGNAGYV